MNFSISELIIFFIIVQSTAIIGAILFGILADSIGQKKTIVLSLLIWIFTVFVAYFTSSKEAIIVQKLSELFEVESQQILIQSFYIVGLLAGSVLGATQSVSRSFMAKLTPENRKTEFFGFFSFFNKSSAILGPLVFGMLSFITGSQRISILSLVLIVPAWNIKSLFFKLTLSKFSISIFFLNLSG